MIGAAAVSGIVGPFVPNDSPAGLHWGGESDPGQTCLQTYLGTGMMDKPGRMSTKHF